MALKKSQKSLKDWTSQEWGTKSGKKSAETGERYLPKSAIDSLSPQEYAASTKKKREDTKKGKQHSKQPKKIAKKTASHRNEGGLMSVEEDETNFFTDNRDTIEAAADIATDFIPVVGEAKGIRDTFTDLSEGDYIGAGFNAAATLFGVVPVAGDAVGKAVKGSEGSVKKFVDEFVEAKNVEKTLENQPAKVEAPKKIKKAYKLFKTKDGNTDEFFPLFVNSDKGIVKNKWIQADVGPIAQSGKVKSKIGELAYRPGWHSGDYASATHIGGKSRVGVTKPDYRPANQVWAEVEVPDDVDWQSIANKNASVVKSGPNKGNLNAKEAHITDRVPNQGHYRYKTNPNMQGNWIISGELKVNKSLSPEQVKKVAAKTGISDLPSLPELIQKEGLSLSDLNQESVKELKKYYPEVYSTLVEPVGKYKGGLMKEPEELYHGGMMSDCGPMSTTEIIVGFDPESGNEVPLGSSAKNVRDDLDAILSDGEYVLPADVVKWHGLKHIQNMHVEAEMGLMSMAMDDLVPTDYDMNKDEVKDMKDNGGFVVDQRAKPLEAEKVTQEPNTKKGKKIKTPEGEIEVAAVESTDKPTKTKKEDKKYASKVKGNLKAFNEGGLAGKKSFPDLNDDGEITQADILKGRGVFYGGGLMDKEGYDEGGLFDLEGKEVGKEEEGGNIFALEDNARMMQEVEDSDEQKDLRDFEDRYAREEDISEEEMRKYMSAEEEPAAEIEGIRDDVESEDVSAAIEKVKDMSQEELEELLAQE